MGPRRIPEALALACLLLASGATAQTTARPGIRVTVTRIGSEGGLSAASFLSIPPSRTTRVHGACEELSGTATALTGSVRGATLHLRAQPGDGQTLPIAESGCGSVSLSLTMEDGSTLTPARGSATLTVDEGGARGHLTATIDEAGVPTTVVADFALRPRT